MHDFIEESNRIEGIAGIAAGEVEAYIAFLALEKIGIKDLERFVTAVQPGAVLRSLPGMDVRVGRHVPPRGGPGVVERLERHLARSVIHERSPWLSHVAYESLHPFMDGNGRSGRVLWAWMRLREDRDPFALGFLHSAYYEALESVREN